LISVQISKKRAVVAFDLKKVQSALIRHLAEHQVSNEQSAKAAASFKHRLNLLLSSYATTHHVVIMDKAYVLSGAEDVTSHVMREFSNAKSRAL
jgi:flagellar hook-basal body complex protein FliE